MSYLDFFSYLVTVVFFRTLDGFRALVSQVDHAGRPVEYTFKYVFYLFKAWQKLIKIMIQNVLLSKDFEERELTDAINLHLE